MTPRLCLALLAVSAVLSACSRAAPAPEVQREVDPAVAAVLADPLMTDPDLASQNRGNAAITLDRFGAVPLEVSSPEAMRAAKAEAARLAGGMVRSAPGGASDNSDALGPVVTAGQIAASLPALPGGCLAALRYDYGFAASLPQVLPVYPRGHVLDAAGSDACRLRAVIFVTPVEPSAVIDYYFTRSSDAGFGTTHRRYGKIEALAGRKAGAAFLVRVRPVGSLSEVALAVRN